MANKEVNSVLRPLACVFADSITTAACI